MDFFERQDRARRSTKLLVAYFGTGVVLLTVAVYLATWVLFAVTTQRHYFTGAEPHLGFWNPKLFSGVAVCTLSIIAIGSIYKTLELAQGGSAVATMLGGRLVDPNTTDPDERKLLNVVEEMAIASGIPVPQVYLLPEERAINAFAAGHSTSDAVVAVTSGSIQLLSRDELQGVIAHEFSHILNGDMRLNLRLMGVVFGILCVAVIGRVLLHTRGRSSRDRNPLPLLGLALVIIGSVGVLFGRLIQAAVSRQREFLADASAVQFTRNPMGLAGALKKIGGLSSGSRLEASHADAASHMYFSNGMGSSLLHLMDTHPPLSKRIKAIDPSFDDVFPNTDALLAQRVSARTTRPPRTSIPFPLPTPSERQAVAGLAPPLFIGPPGIAARAGAPTNEHLQYAAELRAEVSGSLQTAARESLGATALVYALLLSEDPVAQNKQLAELATATSEAVCQETLRLLTEARLVSTRTKLPLVDLALSGLRHLSPAQFQQFRGAVKVLVESDGEIELFEYVLQKIVVRHLEPHYTGARKPVRQYYALKPLAGDCAVLLSALAYVGQPEPIEIQSAFERGAQLLSNAAKVALSLVPEAQCDLEQVDASLNRLALAVPQIKKNVIEACARTVAADAVIQEMEAELLRAIADTLDCPLPPFINDLIPHPV
jgi:Zn-dependent protease with chaperone function